MILPSGSDTGENPGVRIATWNVNSLPARLPRLLAWLATAEPDVLVLQETKTAPDTFPTADLAAAGYESVHRSEGRWNGVALLSRVGIQAPEADLPGAPGFPDPANPPEARYIAATCAGVRVVGVYVPNGRTPDDPHFEYKLEWLGALTEHLATMTVSAQPLAVMGDFNIAPADDDVWDIGAFAGSTHVTPLERTALARMRSLGLSDVVPTINKGPHPFTFWDYRGGAFHKAQGMRIDLVLVNAALAGRVRAAVVDRDARKPGTRGTPAPSDHAPVVVELADA